MWFQATEIKDAPYRGDMTKNPGGGCGGGASLKTLNWTRKEKPECASSLLLLPGTVTSTCISADNISLSPVNKSSKNVDIIKFNLQIFLLGNLKIKSISSISKEASCGTSWRSDIGAEQEARRSLPPCPGLWMEACVELAAWKLGLNRGPQRRKQEPVPAPMAWKKGNAFNWKGHQIQKFQHSKPKLQKG